MLHKNGLFNTENSYYMLVSKYKDIEKYQEKKISD